MESSFISSTQTYHSNHLQISNLQQFYCMGQKPFHIERKQLHAQGLATYLLSDFLDVTINYTNIHESDEKNSLKIFKTSNIVLIDLSGKQIYPEIAILHKIAQMKQNKYAVGKEHQQMLTSLAKFKQASNLITFLQTIEKEMESSKSQFLFGNNMTLGDIILICSTQLHAQKQLNTSKFAQFSSLNRWYDRMQQFPQVKKILSPLNNWKEKAMHEKQSGRVQAFKRYMIHDNEHIYGSKLLKNGSNSAINLKSKVNVKVLDEKKLLLKNKVLQLFSPYQGQYKKFYKQFVISLFQQGPIILNRGVIWKAWKQYRQPTFRYYIQKIVYSSQKHDLVFNQFDCLKLKQLINQISLQLKNPGAIEQVGSIYGKKHFTYFALKNGIETDGVLLDALIQVCQADNIQIIGSEQRVFLIEKQFKQLADKFAKTKNIPTTINILILNKQNKENLSRQNFIFYNKNAFFTCYMKKLSQDIDQAKILKQKFASTLALIDDDSVNKDCQYYKEGHKQYIKVMNCNKKFNSKLDLIKFELTDKKNENQWKKSFFDKFHFGISDFAFKHQFIKEIPNDKNILYNWVHLQARTFGGKMELSNGIAGSVGFNSVMNVYQKWIQQMRKKLKIKVSLECQPIKYTPKSPNKQYNFSFCAQSVKYAISAVINREKNQEVYIMDTQYNPFNKTKPLHLIERQLLSLCFCAKVQTNLDQAKKSVSKKTGQDQSGQSQIQINEFEYDCINYLGRIFRKAQYQKLKQFIFTSIKQNKSKFKINNISFDYNFNTYDSTSHYSIYITLFSLQT